LEVTLQNCCDCDGDLPIRHKCIGFTYQTMLKLLLPIFLLLSCNSRRADQSVKQVKTGGEILIEHHLDELTGKKVGLVMNQTARIDGTHMLDTLVSLGIDVTAILAPEHGFRGEVERGKSVQNEVDESTGVPIYSLYGETRKPTGEMLKNVDLLLFEIQDVGARFYTFNVTMGRVLESAAEHGVEVWVLDRPNPAGGEYVAGWVLEDPFKSFVGAYPVPVAHGMTLGELAKMIVGEQWIDFESPPQLRVFPMENWKRSMKWPDTGLPWLAPSSNLPTFEHAFLYLGTVFFEGTNISEGRGTPDPFLNIGSPQTAIPDTALQRLRNAYPALEIERTTFVPRSMPGKALHPKYEGEKCTGVNISVNSYHNLDPVRFGYDLLTTVMNATPDGRYIDFIENLSGVGLDKDTGTLPSSWEEEVQSFREKRRKYLIYE